MFVKISPAGDMFYASHFERKHIIGKKRNPWFGRAYEYFFYLVNNSAMLLDLAQAHRAPSEYVLWWQGYSKLL